MHRRYCKRCLPFGICRSPDAVFFIHGSLQGRFNIHQRTFSVLRFGFQQPLPNGDDQPTEECQNELKMLRFYRINRKLGTCGREILDPMTFPPVAFGAASWVTEIFTGEEPDWVVVSDLDGALSSTKLGIPMHVSHSMLTLKCI